MLSHDQITAVTRLRHDLHKAPELSGQEANTARLIASFLRSTRPDKILSGIGGHGVAVVYQGKAPGPTILFRAELDALPITEASALPYRSERESVAHLCGHDGHMASLAGLGLLLGDTGLARGRVILLFQPAEETGQGARAVLADPQFAALRPDYAFAYHNMPGLPLGALAVAPGPASCASVGLRLRYLGREAHASSPEAGVSPAPALAALMADLARYAAPCRMDAGFRLATICHLNMGIPAFGIAPGRAEVFVTLRALSDTVLERFTADVEAQAKACAGGLEVQISHHDQFSASINHPDAAAYITRAGQMLGLRKADFDLPMRASEDFGAFSQSAATALFFLGSGEGQPDLHDPYFDFPDALIPTACSVFQSVLMQITSDADCYNRV